MPLSALSKKEPEGAFGAKMRILRAIRGDEGENVPGFALFARHKLGKI